MNKDLNQIFDMLSNVQNQLLKEYGRAATPEEIAEEMAIPLESVTKIINLKKIRYSQENDLDNLIDTSLETIEFLNAKCDKATNENVVKSMEYRIGIEVAEYKRLNLIQDELTN